MGWMENTESLCAHCFQKIPARRVQAGNGAIYLEKECPHHGLDRTLIWQGDPELAAWMKQGRRWPEPDAAAAAPSCPGQCGLCQDHRQETCTALIEVTQRCNLHCCFCFAQSGSGFDDGADQKSNQKNGLKGWAQQEPDQKTLTQLFDLLVEQGKGCNLQLSGGEPTMREDLPEIIQLARSRGIGFVQVNSNGIRLGQQEDYVRRLKEAGLDSVYLQFDGVTDQVYETLRGRALLQIKEQAIVQLRKYEIGVVLVPTLVPGVNTDQIGAIIRFALANAPAVRGVHFQPVSYFGRIPVRNEAPGKANRADSFGDRGLMADLACHTGQADTTRPEYGVHHEKSRFTLPDLLREIEAQTGGRVGIKDLKPACCEHPLCSFNGRFLLDNAGGLTPLSGQEGACCPKPATAGEGAKKAKTATARSWRGVSVGKTAAISGVSSWDQIGRDLKRRTFTLSGMVFQDVWNLDLERVRQCCVHVVTTDKRRVPFCLYYLTDGAGRSYSAPVAKQIRLSERGQGP